MKHRSLIPCILTTIFILLASSCERSIDFIECLNNSAIEVGIISEFVQVRNLDNVPLGVGTLSFSYEGVLYGIGHECSIKDELAIAYKINPKFVPDTIEKIGTVEKNEESEEEMLGIISNADLNGIEVILNEDISLDVMSVQVAHKITSGDAEILIRDENGILQKYSIIVEIISNEDETYLQCFVTDEELLQNTGGILKGMSGSPIMKDGELIGILTHRDKENSQMFKAKIIWDILF